MRTLLPLLCALSLSAALPAQTPAARPGAGAKPASPAEAKEGVIAGLTLPRPNGQFLGVEVAAGNWKVTFYDKKKHPVPPDVARGHIRWVIQGKGDHERSVLNPGPDGHSLVGSRFVRPPYRFQLFLTLIYGEGAAAPETYTLNYQS